MPEGKYIQVILPLRLEWEPFYCMEDALVGERVKVEFAHRSYVGVVSRTGVQPDVEVEKILPATKTDLPLICEKEIAFWRVLADYYLCTTGEVFKIAYPSVLRQGKPKKVPELTGAEVAEPELSPAQKEALEGMLEAFRHKKTVLLQGAAGSGKTQLYQELARRTLAQGRSVLYLVPEIALSRQLEERLRAAFPDLLVYDSQQTMAIRRAIATVVREEEKTLVLGTRSALFLPHHNLGLVIVDDEHEASYKQDSPAPRYNTRDAAILLAGIQGAQVVLGSATPSLESLYNAETGRFDKLVLKNDFRSEESASLLLVNTAAELRKKGMAGSFSLKLLEEMHRSYDAGEKVLVVCRSKAVLQEVEAELRNIFPAAPEGAFACITPAGIKLLSAGEYALTAVLQADILLGKEDFRADEKSLQLLQQLRHLSGRLTVVQTRESKHPVFQALAGGGDGLALIDERRIAQLPPFTRLIDIELRDKNPARLKSFSTQLGRELSSLLPTVLGPYAPQQDFVEGQYLRRIRIVLPRDKMLKSRKETLLAAVGQFEKDQRYTPGHIFLDVDPA